MILGFIYLFINVMFFINVMSRFKDILHLLAQRTTLSRSSFSFCEVLMESLTTKNFKVSSSMSFTLASRLPDKSLIYIKKNNGPKNWTLRHTRFYCQVLTFCCLSYFLLSCLFRIYLFLFFAVRVLAISLVDQNSCLQVF